MTTPNLYYFDNKSQFKQFKLKNIEGNAIILIGNSVKVVLVKNKIQQDIVDIDPEVQTFITDSWNEIHYSKLSAKTGKIITELPVLQKLIKDIAEKLDFPYAHISIKLSRDGKLISFLDDKNIPLQHPLLEEKGDSAYGFKALEFMRHRDAQQCILYKVYKRDDLQPPLEAMEVILKSLNPTYKNLFDGIPKITRRFSQSSKDLTKAKTEILKDFKQYCCLNAEDGMKPADLVEGWVLTYKNKPVIKYKDKFVENPFTVLLEQRRTTGPLSIFSQPSKTDSIKLFEQFIGKKNITCGSLETMYAVEGILNKKIMS